MKNLQIRILKSDMPELKTELFYTEKAEIIIQHFFEFYTEFTFTLFKRNSFWLYIYKYIDIAVTNETEINKIF